MSGDIHPCTHILNFASGVTLDITDFAAGSISLSPVISGGSTTLTVASGASHTQFFLDGFAGTGAFHLVTHGGGSQITYG